MAASGEERFIAEYLAPLAAAHPGAYGLTDDCAELAPLPGHVLIFKTDPIVEGVHFLPDDAPEDLRQFVYIRPEAGEVVMWESWLRHEVMMNMTEEDRISISFNFGWR